MYLVDNFWQVKPCFRIFYWPTSQNNKLDKNKLENSIFQNIRAWCVVPPPGTGPGMFVLSFFTFEPNIRYWRDSKSWSSMCTGLRPLFAFGFLFILTTLWFLGGLTDTNIDPDQPIPEPSFINQANLINMPNPIATFETSEVEKHPWGVMSVTRGILWCTICVLVLLASMARRKCRCYWMPFILVTFDFPRTGYLPGRDLPRQAAHHGMTYVLAQRDQNTRLLLVCVCF